MKKYNVELLPAAYSDLDEIFDYIMADNLQAATKTLDNIMSSLHRLEEFPQSGVPLTEGSLKKFNFKMVIINPYIAFSGLLMMRLSYIAFYIAQGIILIY